MSGFVVQEDAAEPVNYRQVGRGVQGKIKQGEACVGPAHRHNRC